LLAAISGDDARGYYTGLLVSVRPLITVDVRISRLLVCNILLPAL